MKIALVSHKVLEKGTSAAILAQHDPSFEELAELCKSFILDIRNYQNNNKEVCAAYEISSGEEFLVVLNEIVEAISKNDNKMLDDCTIHLDECFSLIAKRGMGLD